MCVFVYASVVFIKFGHFHTHKSHPTNSLHIEYHANPNIGSSSAVSVLTDVCVFEREWLGVGVCVGVCTSVCVFVSKSVRAREGVSAISDRREYVFLSIARRMEKSGMYDSIREMGVKP